MNSPKTSPHDKIIGHRSLAIGYQSGFTFIEIIIVLAIILVFAGLGLFLSFDTLRSNTFQADAEAAIVTILRARSRATNNIGESNHGFKVDQTNHEFILFEVDSGEEERITFNPELTFSGSGVPEFVTIFDQLTGNLVGGVPALPMSMTHNGRTADIYINSEGRIDWEIN